MRRLRGDILHRQTTMSSSIGTRMDSLAHTIHTQHTLHITILQARVAHCSSCGPSLLSRPLCPLHVASPPFISTHVGAGAALPPQHTARTLLRIHHHPLPCLPCLSSIPLPLRPFFLCFTCGAAPSLSSRFIAVSPVVASTSSPPSVREVRPISRPRRAISSRVRPSSPIVVRAAPPSTAPALHSLALHARVQSSSIFLSFLYLSFSLSFSSLFYRCVWMSLTLSLSLRGA